MHHRHQPTNRSDKPLQPLHTSLMRLNSQTQTQPLLRSPSSPASASPLPAPCSLFPASSRTSCTHCRSCRTPFPPPPAALRCRKLRQPLRTSSAIGALRKRAQPQSSACLANLQLNTNTVHRSFSKAQLSPASLVDFSAFVGARSGL